MRGTRGPAPRPVAKRPVPWTTIAIGAVVVALGGFVMFYGRPAATDEAAPPLAATAAVSERSREPAPLGAFAAADTRPAAQSLAVDAIRAGEVAYNAGNVAAALDHYRAALEASPDHPEALNNVGQMLVRLGRPAEAIPYFDRAIARAPDTWAYRFNRARAYGEMQEWTQAIAGYRDAARLFPDDYATVFNLGRAQQANGDLEAAIRSYDRAIELAPGQADFHLTHAGALELAGRPADAAAAYRRYLELEPAAPQAEKIRERLSQLQAVQSGS